MLIASSFKRVVRTGQLVLEYWYSISAKDDSSLYGCKTDLGCEKGLDSTRTSRPDNPAIPALYARPIITRVSGAFTP
jgi:hypothetical protein